MRPDRLHVVLDEDDSAACARWAKNRHDLQRGRVVTRPAPQRTDRTLARDVLRALGKRLTLRGAPAAQRDLWPHAELWLQAEQVRELYVLRAHRLTPDAVRPLLRIADRLGLDLWLFAAADRPPAGIDPGCCTITTFAEQQAASMPRPRRRPEHTRPWPALPAEEFFTFRASALVALEEADARRIDAELFVGRMIAQEIISRHDRDRRALDTRSVEGLLAGVLTTAAEPEQALCRIRGAQTALFMAGAYVQAPADAIRAAMAARPGPLDSHAASLLRSFTDPQSAAVGVLSLTSDAPACLLRDLDVADIDDDGSTFELHGRRYPAPAQARGLIRAQRQARVAQGYDDSAPLFVSRRSPTERMSVAALRGVLQRVCEATGLTVNTFAGQGPRGHPRWPTGCITVNILDQDDREIAA